MQEGLSDLGVGGVRVRVRVRVKVKVRELSVNSTSKSIRTWRLPYQAA